MDESFNDIKQMATHLRYILQEAPKRLEANIQEVNLCDKEIGDIQHALELSNFNAAQGYKYAKDIQIARKRRRELKNEIELLTPLVNYIDTLKVNRNQLNLIIGEIRKSKERQSVRTYKMRVRTDLQEKVVAK